MRPVEKRVILLTTHLGVLAVAFLFARNLNASSSSKPPLRTLSAPSRSHPTASVWVHEKLAEVQEKLQQRAADIKFAKSATLPERMKRDREEREAKYKKLLEQVARVQDQASRFGTIRDPKRELLGGLAGEEETEHLFSIALWWLRDDRDTALQELAQPAFDELTTWNTDLAGALLRAEFGAAWVSNRIRSKETPALIRSLLAQDLGREVGQHGGLPRLADEFRSLPDPFLQVELIDEFIHWWKLEEPATTAHFLIKQAPPAFRDLFLGELIPTFSLNHTWKPWREALNEHLTAADLPEYVTELALTFPLTEPLGFWDPKPPGSRTLAEQLEPYTGNSDHPVRDTVRSLVADWIDEGTDLRELYGEGRMSRSELLAQLSERIPGVSAYPDQLEEAAWLATVGHSSPDKATAWARDLSTGPNFSVGHRMFINKADEDPRLRMVMERLRIGMTFGTTGIGRSEIRRRAHEAFEEWLEVGPVHARIWRDDQPNNIFNIPKEETP